MHPILDCHLHTAFSADGRSDPECLILQAIERGFKHICITDHMDLFYYDPSFTPIDLDQYFSALLPLKQKYADKIYVAVGIEAGYTPQNAAENFRILNSRSFDYVIGSVHEVDKADCFEAADYLKMGRHETYRRYFQAVSDSLDVPYKIHALGHLGYIFRYAPFLPRLVTDNEFDELLNEIFCKVMRRGIVVELNTSAYGSGTPTLPNRELLTKYRALGGDKICFSSDAHDLDRLGDGYDVATEIAKSCGFTHWTIIQNQQELRIKI